MEVNIHEAKTHLSRLIQQALAGEEVTIAKAGKPLVRLTPIAEKKMPILGSARGTVTLPPGWDDPLTENELREFEDSPLLPSGADRPE